MKTTWRKQITEEMRRNGDGFNRALLCTLSEAELDIEFDPSYGGTEGLSFFVWTNDRVYFAGCYDGSEWCTSVPRNPTLQEKPEHIGGG